MATEAEVTRAKAAFKVSMFGPDPSGGRMPQQGTGAFGLDSVSWSHDAPPQQYGAYGPPAVSNHLAARPQYYDPSGADYGRGVAQHYATGPGFPGPYNVYIPNLQSSGELIVGYSRNVQRFGFPKYAQYVESDRLQGFFLKLSPQEAARVVTTQEFEWPDGTPRPMREEGVEQFNYVNFFCHRYENGFPLGWMTRQQAEWNIEPQHLQIHGAKAMTLRTNLGLTALTTVSNWTVSGGTDIDLSQDHTQTASSLAGGTWDSGTSTNPYIKISMDKVAVLINKETLGVVEQDQGLWIVNPNTARLMAESSEIHEYIKGSYWAREELIEGLHPNNKFGLPSSIYGYPIIVENTVLITSRKNVAAAPTKSFAMPDQTAVYVSRVGGLEGVYGAPSFSTLSWFWFNDELSMEQFDDPLNRLTRGSVVQAGVAVVTSPLAGFLVTTATSKAS